mgnify:CR=1 FL=1
MDFRKRKEILKDIKNLVSQKGFIYALCMILFEDFHINIELSHEIDRHSRLNMNEASLLLGFLIQKDIDFSLPKSIENVFAMKDKTYALMDELHKSFHIPLMNKFAKSRQEGYVNSYKDFFAEGDMLIEPIFYSGSAVYDFQYLEFLERKYKYDKDWLIKKRNFDFETAKNFAINIKDSLQEKSKKVNLYSKEGLVRLKNHKKELESDKNWEEEILEMKPVLDLYQYHKLFPKRRKNTEHVTKGEWETFYENLIDLFVVKKIDFENYSNYLKSFSTKFGVNINDKFKDIGDINQINISPIIKFDDNTYFVPIPFLLFQSIYESPFYWMVDDKDYLDQLSGNRGKVSEEITHEFLSGIFGKENTYISVKVRSPKSENSTTNQGDDTDIDILCLLGSKALCVQVKSKKLSQLARTGNDVAIKSDFEKAIQSAYSQGLISRNKILQKNSKFYDNYDNELELSEAIDEVFILGVTTENYPSLTHQAHILIDKKETDPFPLFTTIFDLELLAHYLKDPYDFLYYVRQRIALVDYFKADDEIAFLGYHLVNKLWKLDTADYVQITSDFAQLIDRNYYPYKLGLKVSDENDRIKAIWKNEEFYRLCNRLKEISEPKITDIIFHLLDLSGDTRDNLLQYINRCKQTTLNNNRESSFTFPPESNQNSKVGINYISFDNDNFGYAADKVKAFCELRKYKSKADVWIGFYSFKNSNEIIDGIYYMDQVWKYDEVLEDQTKNLFEGESAGNLVRLNKVGRNEKCPCGSGKKYKKCCLIGINLL